MNIDERITNETINQNITNMKTFNNPEGLYIAKPKQQAAPPPEVDAFTINKLKGTPFVAYPKNVTVKTAQPVEPGIALQDGMFISYPAAAAGQVASVVTETGGKSFWRNSSTGNLHRPVSSFFRWSAEKWSGKSNFIFMNFLQRIKMKVS